MIRNEQMLTCEQTFMLFYWPFRLSYSFEYLILRNKDKRKLLKQPISCFCSFLWFDFDTTLIGTLSSVELGIIIFCISLKFAYFLSDSNSTGFSCSSWISCVCLGLGGFWASVWLWTWIPQRSRGEFNLCLIMWCHEDASSPFLYSFMTSQLLFVSHRVLREYLDSRGPRWVIVCEDFL